MYILHELRWPASALRHNPVVATATARGLLTIHGPRTQMTPIFEGQPPPKQGRNSNQNRGHLGSRDTLVQFFSTIPNYCKQQKSLTKSPFPSPSPLRPANVYPHCSIGNTSAQSGSIYQFCHCHVNFPRSTCKTTTFRCCYCQTCESSVVSEALALVKASVLATSRKKWRLVGLPDFFWGKKNWSTETLHKVDGWNPTYRPGVEIRQSYGRFPWALHANVSRKITIFRPGNLRPLRPGWSKKKMKNWLKLQELLSPKDHWTLKTGYFEDPTPAIQVQTLPLEGPRSLGSA